jgi:hypothetical protein
MSTMNSRLEIDSCHATLTPLRSTFIFASSINLLNALMTIRNTKGDKVQPCISPLEALKNLEGAPLIRTTKDAKWMHPKI